MVKFNTALLAAGLSLPLAISGIAWAQASSPDAQQVQARTEARIASLHTQLQITPAQEPAWQAFASVMKQNSEDMAASLAARQKNFASMNAVQDLQNYAEMSTQQAEHLNKLISPFQTLYAQLSPTQKATADRLFHSYSERAPHARG